MNPEKWPVTPAHQLKIVNRLMGIVSGDDDSLAVVAAKELVKIVDQNVFITEAGNEDEDDFENRGW